MKAGDLILMIPASAVAGGLTGLIQHAARPGEFIYLLTSIILFVIGAGAFGGLFLALRRMRDDERS